MLLCVSTDMCSLPRYLEATREMRGKTYGAAGASFAGGAVARGAVCISHVGYRLLNIGFDWDLEEFW